MNVAFLSTKCIVGNLCANKFSHTSDGFQPLIEEEARDFVEDEQFNEAKFPCSIFRRVLENFVGGWETF